MRAAFKRQNFYDFICRSIKYRTTVTRLLKFCALHAKSHQSYHAISYFHTALFMFSIMSLCALLTINTLWKSSEDREEDCESKMIFTSHLLLSAHESLRRPPKNHQIAPFWSETKLKHLLLSLLLYYFCKFDFVKCFDCSFKSETFVNSEERSLTDIAANMELWVSITTADNS